MLRASAGPAEMSYQQYIFTSNCCFTPKVYLTLKDLLAHWCL